MKRVRALSTLVRLVAVMALTLVVEPVMASDHEAEEADAERRAAITRHARELADLLVRGESILEDAEPQDTVLQQRQRDAAEGAMRRATEAAVEHAKQLEAGASLDETLLYFGTIRDHVRSTLETAGDARPTSEGRVLRPRLFELLDELEQLYQGPLMEAEPAS